MRNRPFLGLWWFEWLGFTWLAIMAYFFLLPPPKCMKWHEEPRLVWRVEGQFQFPEVVYDRVCDKGFSNG